LFSHISDLVLHPERITRSPPAYRSTCGNVATIAPSPVGVCGVAVHVHLAAQGGPASSHNPGLQRRSNRRIGAACRNTPCTSQNRAVDGPDSMLERGYCTEPVPTRATQRNPSARGRRLGLRLGIHPSIQIVPHRLHNLRLRPVIVGRTSRTIFGWWRCQFFSGPRSCRVISYSLLKQN